MLKMLMKIGNSNAVLLDKALLEILNIDERTWLKLSTDGKSLIITPVTETTQGLVTPSEANTIAFAKEADRLHPSGMGELLKMQNLPEEVKKARENRIKEFSEESQLFTTRGAKLADELFKNEQFRRDLADLTTRVDAIKEPLLYVKEVYALHQRYKPELAEINEALKKKSEIFYEDLKKISE